MAPSARQTYRFARGLRRLVRRPVTPEAARATVAAERAARSERFLRSLDVLVWPTPQSPLRLLLANAGLERGDVERLVAGSGLDGALEVLRDAGVYVAYEEYQGTSPARRGSATFEFSPPDFFNPATTADYLASTGGSRSAGTPVELSFAYERRQAVLRSLGYQASDMLGAPTAIWLPVFPSAAGFSAVIKSMGGGNRPERWFSQIGNRTAGVTAHKLVLAAHAGSLVLRRPFPRQLAAGAAVVIAAVGAPAAVYILGRNGDPLRWIDAPRARGLVERLGAVAGGGPLQLVVYGAAAVLGLVVLTQVVRRSPLTDEPGGPPCRRCGWSSRPPPCSPSPTR